MALRINITKRPDGGSVLKCVRDDGTETWQKLTGNQATFFPLHDLTHYAVECELGVHDAFFGLVAAGWSIEETTGLGPRGALPPDALFVETLVGTLDMERASGSRWSAGEFNDTLALKAANDGRPAPRLLTDDEILRIRRRRAELFSLWHELAPGKTLQLEF